MKVYSAAPTFLVHDIAATARWYERELGFTVNGHFPETEPYVYGSLQLGGAEIMLLNLEGYEKPDLSDRRPAGFWDVYIQMSGVRELYDKNKAKDFIRMHLKLQPYGNWEFEVKDPNGYFICFGGNE